MARCGPETDFKAHDLFLYLSGSQPGVILTPQPHSHGTFGHIWRHIFDCHLEKRNWYGMVEAKNAAKCPIALRTAPQWKVAAKSLQSWPTLCDPIDGSPPGSPSLGFSRQEHWSGLPFSFSNAWKWKVKGKSLSRVWPSATPWTAAYPASLSMGFSRQEYWSGMPLPSPNGKLSSLKCQ